MMLATFSDPGLFVVVSLHCGPGWFHITLVFPALSYIRGLLFRSTFDMCLSSFGVREHQVRSDTGRPHRGFHLST